MAEQGIHISWDESSKDRWMGLLSLVPNSCYLHSWGYGEAIHQHTDKYARRGIIYKSVTPIGLVQAIQEKSLLGLQTRTTIIRGPQWIEGCATFEDKAESLIRMRAYFERGLGNSFEILPDIEETPQNLQMMKELGFKLRENGQTVNYLDLTQDISHLRGGLDFDWLDALREVEQQNLKVDFRDDYRSLEWILEKYAEDADKQGLNHLPLDFIRCFLSNNEKPIFVTKVMVVEPELAGALVITHGKSATYFLSWTSPEGIEKKANYLALWDSIIKMQRMGLQSLDLGGMDMQLDGIKKGLIKSPKLLVGFYG